jgi:hypothetical protein
LLILDEILKDSLPGREKIREISFDSLSEIFILLLVESSACPADIGSVFYRDLPANDLSTDYENLLNASSLIY